MKNIKVLILLSTLLFGRSVLSIDSAEKIKDADAFKRYMVAVNENIGVGKKERCTILAFYSTVHPWYQHEEITLQMRCPRKKIFGYASANNTLNNIVDGWLIQRRNKHEAEIAQKKQELAQKKEEILNQKGFISALDKASLKPLERTIASLERLKEYTHYFSAPYPDHRDTISIDAGWFLSSDCRLSTQMPKDKYESLVKELREQEKAELVCPNSGTYF